MVKRVRPYINIITRGEAKTRMDEESPHQIKIQKVVPKNTKYDPIRLKELFKNVVEIFRQMHSPSTHVLSKMSSKLRSHHPRVARASSAQMESLGMSQKAVDI
jgi:hypothetical protein